MTITMSDLANDAGLPAPKKVKKPKKTEGADRVLVATVREELRVIIARTTDKGIDESGDLLLERFFGDDHKRYGGKNPESPSLNLLLERCGKHDLHVSRTFLGNALRLAVFGRTVSKGSAFPQLSPSHRVELLCLGDPTDAGVVSAVETLAGEALENKYSVRYLRKVVKDFRCLEKRRKPVNRTLDSCVRATTDGDTGELAFTGKDFAGMTLEQVEHTERQALVLAQRAQAIAALARARREELASAPPVKAAEPKAEVAPKTDELPALPESKPEVQEPAATAEKGSAGKAPPAGSSRRRDAEKAAPSVVKAKRRAAAEKPAASSAGSPDEVSRTSETTAATDAEAASEARARKAKKTAT